MTTARRHDGDRLVGQVVRGERQRVGPGTVPPRDRLPSDVRAEDGRDRTDGFPYAVGREQGPARPQSWASPAASHLAQEWCMALVERAGMEGGTGDGAAPRDDESR